jgi:soluble lytic murein transglycosylase
MRRTVPAFLLLAVFGCGVRGGWRIDVPITTIKEKQAAFGQAYAAFLGGDDTIARPLFAALARHYPETADHSLYFLGVLHRRAGDDGDAGRVFAQLLERYPQSVHVPAAALGHGRLLQHAGRDREARPRLQRALQAADAEVRNAARLGLAEIDLRSGAVADAYSGFARVRDEAVGSREARIAKERVFDLRSKHAALQPRGEQLLEEGRLLLKEGDTYTAQRVAERLVAGVPGVEPGESERLQADVWYQQGRMEDTFKALWDVAQRFPHRASGRNALLRMARLLWNRDRDDAARRAFKEFLRRYPHERGASDALYAIGRIDETAGRLQAAVRSFAELTRRYPRSRLVHDARWRLGWIRYRNRRWDAAADAFAELARRASGRDRQGGLYWQARALEQAGKRRQASQLYARLVADDEKGYYGAWARRRLENGPAVVRVSSPGGTEGALPEAHVFADPAFDAVADPFHLMRWRELRQAGVNALARVELRAVRRVHSEDVGVLRDLMLAYHGVDGFSEALRLAHRLGGRARLSAFERERILYPLAFWDVVRHEGVTNEIDPLLLESIMRQESLFDPEARSPANARGLMQLLPSTAEQVAASSVAAVDAEDLTTPAVNVKLGAIYLRTLLGRYRGDLVKALAAYNGGEAAVEKWERRAPHLETDEFVENISYRETRDYVKRVLANFQTYESIYRPR